MMNVRHVSTSLTAIVFVLLARQKCLTFPIEVICLATGMVLLGSLCYLAASELVVMIQLDRMGEEYTATVVDVRVNKAGWKRLQVEIALPHGRRLRKWVDALTTVDYEMGDTVSSVALSRDWKHCRLQACRMSSCKPGMIMSILAMVTIVTTGKIIVLSHFILNRAGCRGDCAAGYCQGEVGIRLIYAILVGFTVYVHLFRFVQLRYYDGFPSLTEYEMQGFASLDDTHDSCKEADTETIGLSASWDDEDNATVGDHV